MSINFYIYPLWFLMKILFWHYFKHSDNKQLPGYRTHLGRARAWLRLALMQKKLADYVKVLIDHREDLLLDFYEPDALMMSEEAIVIMGLLVGLNVIDCNLCVKVGNCNPTDIPMIVCFNFASSTLYCTIILFKGKKTWFKTEFNKSIFAIFCILYLQGEDLDSQQGVIDFSLYLRCSNQPGETLSEDTDLDNMSTVLDQKNYIEELNRHLKYGQ